MEQHSVSKFVVGMIRPGIATLVSEDHEVVEFPSHLLPSGVFVGCVVELAVAVRPTDQQARLSAINGLFEEIERQASSEIHAPKQNPPAGGGEGAVRKQSGPDQRRGSAAAGRAP